MSKKPRVDKLFFTLFGISTHYKYIKHIKRKKPLTFIRGFSFPCYFII